MNLQFCQSALQDEKPTDCRPPREAVDFDIDPGKVRGHLLHSMYMYNHVVVVQASSKVIQ